MSSSYRVHSLPPPTVNVLTTRQKTHLRRSSTKISKVLGATPQFMDADPRPSSRAARALAQLHSNDLQPSLTVQSPRSATGSSSGRRYSVDSYSKPKPSAYTHRLSLDTSSTRTPSTSSNAFARRKQADSPSPTFPSPTPRPSKDDSDSRSTYSRLSVCDSLYEPTFAIPSATTLRRKKMARVCKLLGDGVPVELVFPEDQPEVPTVSKAVVEDDRSFLDIRPESSATLDSLSTVVASEAGIHSSRSFDKPLPKRPSFRESSQSSRTLAPIRERLSLVSDIVSSDSDDAPGLSQGSSVESLFSTLHTDDESPAPSTPVSPTREPPSPFSVAYGSWPVRQAVAKASSRREFSIHVPRRASYIRHHRRGSSGSDIVRTKVGSQELEFEIVQGVTDLQL